MREQGSEPRQILNAKEKIDSIVTAVVEKIAAVNVWDLKQELPVLIDILPDDRFGDLSSPFPLSVAHRLDLPPMKIAFEIQKGLEAIRGEEKFFDSVTVGAPGYINFILSDEWLQEAVRNTLRQSHDQCLSNVMQSERILLELETIAPVENLQFRQARGVIAVDVLSKLFQSQGAAVWSNIGDNVLTSDLLESISDPLKSHEGYTRIVKVVECGDYGEIAQRIPQWEQQRIPVDKIEFLLYQPAHFKQGDRLYSLSDQVLHPPYMKEMLGCIDRDVIRYFLMMKDLDSQMIFDWDIAEIRSMDNPVYHKQYVHAQICGIIKKGEQMGLKASQEKASLLSLPEERALMKALLLYPSTVALSAQLMQPHRLTVFLENFAKSFHSYYTYKKIVDPENEDISEARLALVDAVRIIMADVMTLLGVTTPCRM